jgi:hypothetical protein
LITQADADRAVVASQTADNNVKNFEKERGGVADINTELAVFKSYDGTAITLTVNANTGQLTSTLGGLASLAGQGGMVNPAGYHPPTVSTYHPISWNVLAGGGGLANPAPRDSGGPGMAGTPYLIGTGAQPELFVPSQSGQFYPQGKGMGNTYNITVINPKRETAENSIRAALKNISFLGQVQDGA